MARQNAFGFDLSDASLRHESLPPRYAPYWQVTEYGRAVGYEKYVSGRSYWLARMCLRDGSYHQHRIAATEDNAEFRGGLSFEAACHAAQLWFATTPLRIGASDAKPIGPYEHLLACPYWRDLHGGSRPR